METKRNVMGWAWLIIVVVIVGVLFYWFGVRPGQIREECQRLTYYGNNYDACLNEHGL